MCMCFCACICVVCMCVRACVHACVITWNCLGTIYVSKCSASIQIPHIQTVLTKHIKAANLGHKM